MEEEFRFGFCVYGTICPKQRPRATITNGYAKVYTPQKTREYEQTIKQYALASGCKNVIGSKPFSVKIIARFAVPKSYSKKKKKQLLQGQCYCQNKKDIDNIAKIVLDALNGIEYDDDHNCVALEISKRWAKDDRERLEIGIYA